MSTLTMSGNINTKSDIVKTGAFWQFLAGLEGVAVAKYETWKEELAAEFRDEFQSLAGLDLSEVLPFVLSREECWALLAVYDGDSDKDKRNRLIMRLFYATGVRIAELAEFRFADVNYDSRTIFVRSGKGDKDRYVCVDVETLEMVTVYQGESASEEKLFKIGIRQIRRVVETAGEAIGIEEKFKAVGRKFSAHSLRHAFATHSYENGMRLFTLRKLLGHEYLGTTQIYINTAMQWDTAEYERAGPFAEVCEEG